MARMSQLCSPVMKWARVDRELETINSRTVADLGQCSG